MMIKYQTKEKSITLTEYMVFLICHDFQLSTSKCVKEGPRRGQSFCEH